ncbi:Phage XkdN-like tail assembly chaperone protein, TAC [Granulicatella balaenopterae]|uniref:Phage XkdN-like tail assembly chaperone protein, TAC n=1 Tax=Granulicatella balaenopterae TaxID=137733 RepID=A0A1H9IL27_9LACT|nr:hypothetical protein [Granulicatella balaenopterae]SEQ75256.1 Phage XkdN-like tail assembly chaperone protein, TAC [Granulicatella balaenopterae]
MSNIKNFFKSKKKNQENKKFKLPNFGDAEFEIKVLTSDELEKINAIATTHKVGKNGKQVQIVNEAVINREMCVRSLVVPDLNDAELQKDWGCMGASELFGKMFDWYEAAQILKEVSKIAGIEDINQEIDEAKN